jgi:hypothetical protein
MSVFIKGMTLAEAKWLLGATKEHEIVEVKTPHGSLYEETKIIDFAKDMKISASDYATWWYGEDAVIEAEVE